MAKGKILKWMDEYLMSDKLFCRGSSKWQFSKEPIYSDTIMNLDGSIIILFTEIGSSISKNC